MAGVPFHRRPCSPHPRSPPVAQHESLASQFAITSSNLARRREFIRLGEEERALLTKLIPWAKQATPGIAREFYDWQFSFGPTKKFFQSQAERMGHDMASLRRVLETKQAEYLLNVFEGARGSWGTEHFENRLNVGRVHDVIDLPMKWYLGSYTEFDRLIRIALKTEIPDAEQREQALAAIQKVFNYDIQAVVDSYTLSVFKTIGVRMSDFTVQGEEDRTECIAAIKKRLTTALHEIATCASTLGSSSASLAAISEQFSSTSTAVAAAMEEMSASIKEIAGSSASASKVAQNAVISSSDASGAMNKLGQSSRDIQQVIKLISAIAGQTNLLALNATIEAARAGEAGKGFAVVAAEVKELARQTATATGDIGRMIEAIQSGTAGATDGIGKISGIIKDISEYEHSIAAAVEEQSTVISDISRNAQAASASANETRSAAEGLRDLATRLDGLVKQFDLKDNRSEVRAAR